MLSSNAQDVSVPIKWLSDLFDKYLPNTIFEMKESFSHITPLSTMNFVTVSSMSAALATASQAGAVLHRHLSSASQAPE